MRPLRSVDIKTKAEAVGAIERSDVGAIPAAAVIAEAVVAFELAAAFLEKFGGDSLTEITRNFKGFLQQVRNYLSGRDWIRATTPMTPELILTGFMATGKISTGPIHARRLR